MHDTSYNGGLHYSKSSGTISSCSLTDQGNGWYLFSVTGYSVAGFAATIYVKRKPATITFDGNGGSPSTQSITASSYGASITLPNATRDGYSLVGWYTDEVGGTFIGRSGDSYTPGLDETLYAQWRVKQGTVVFNAMGGSVSPLHQSVSVGSAVGSLPRPTRSGYTFSGWYTSATGGSQITSSTTMPTSGMLVAYARWVAGARYYTLTFDAAGGSVSTTTRSVQEGATLGTLPTPTRANHSFVGWFSSDGAQVTSATVMPDDDLIVYARWSANAFTVTFNANGGTASESTRSVPYGRQINRLPSAWKDGGRLLGWYTSASGGTKIEKTHVVTANMTLYARWGEAIDWWVVEPV